MIEVLFASSLFFHILLIFIPIHTSIHSSSQVLNEKRLAAIFLHEEFQGILQKEYLSLPYSSTRKENHTDFNIQFLEDNEYVKGCVVWTNAKQSEEIFCLYGIFAK
jgi:hypothetical protein